MQEPYESHWQAAKSILRYLRGTTHMGIIYSADVYIRLLIFSDANRAGDLDEQRSTYFFIFWFWTSLFISVPRSNSG